MESTESFDFILKAISSLPRFEKGQSLLALAGLKSIEEKWLEIQLKNEERPSIKEMYSEKISICKKQYDNTLKVFRDLGT